MPFHCQHLSSQEPIHSQCHSVGQSEGDNQSQMRNLLRNCCQVGVWGRYHSTLLINYLIILGKGAAFINNKYSLNQPISIFANSGCKLLVQDFEDATLSACKKCNKSPISKLFSEIEPTNNIAFSQQKKYFLPHNCTLIVFFFFHFLFI